MVEGFELQQRAGSEDFHEVVGLAVLMTTDKIGENGLEPTDHPWIESTIGLKRSEAPPPRLGCNWVGGGGGGG